MAEIDTDIGDPSLDSAVAKIMARGSAAFGDEPQEDKRENRTDRDATEEGGSTDLEESEAEQRAQPNEDDEDKDGAASDGEDAQFIEIPGGEGDEPVRVPVTEAAEAVTKLRQMNGDIATAVIKAETESWAKQDAITERMNEALQVVGQRAQAALHLMQQFLPQPPDRAMLDDRSDAYNPQGYYAQKAYYDDYVAHAQRVQATVAQATSGQRDVMTAAETAEMERENTRLARYVPEWADAKTRETKRGEIIAALSAKYGVTEADMTGVVSHKAWRIMHDLANLVQVQTKAPDIKKAVQEKAPKIVNGRVQPSRDPNSGQFSSSARKELRETGSVDAAARLFMRSGALKGL